VYGWPLLFFIGLGWLVYDPADIQTKSLSAQAGFLSCQLLWVLAILFCYFLALIFARPSLDKKNCEHVARYTKKYFAWYVLQPFMLIAYTAAIVVMAFPVLVVWSKVIVTAQPAIDFFAREFSVSAVEYCVSTFLRIVGILSALFLLDLGGGLTSLVKSTWFGIKMALYNLPFVCIVIILSAMIHSLHTTQIIRYLMHPFWLCVIANYYTKKVHDQAQLYPGVAVSK